MKKIVCTAFLLTVGYGAQAALVDNGGFTSDTDTGLDWADLSATAGLSYNDAGTVFDTYEGGGWRYATDAEVETIFDVLFDGYYSNSQGTAGYSFEGNIDHYADQAEDVANFVSLFGISDTHQYGTYSYGLYADENGDIRMMGAAVGHSTGNYSTVYGTDFDYAYSQTDAQDYQGAYLVRSTGAEVPVPAAVWLFGSALFGLVGLSRKNSALS